MRNKEKISLANTRQESQRRVTKKKKKKRKWVENRKVFASGEDSDFLSTGSSSQAKKKTKPHVGDIANRHRHLLQLPPIKVPLRNRIMIGLKLLLKMKNLNGNYLKVWPTTQANILKRTFQRVSMTN